MATTEQQESIFLSEDIVKYEILPWVPVQALLRFIWVSREWYRLILNDKIFQTMRKAAMTMTSPSLVYHGRDVYVFLSHDNVVRPFDYLKRPQDCRNFVILASSNGLLCCRQNIYLYVTNPVTKESVSIPADNIYMELLGFHFEPSCLDPYYIVVVPKITYKFSTQDCAVARVSFKVYSSKLGVWVQSNGKLDGSVLQKPTSFMPNEAVYIDGVFYWLIRDILLWYSVKEETAGVITLPYDHEEHFPSHIGDCKGELRCTKVTNMCVSIWVLRWNEVKTDFKWVRNFLFNFVYDDTVRIMRTVYDDYNVSSIHMVLIIQPLPYEGGDFVRFWVRTGVTDEAVFSFHLLSRVLRVIENSQMSNTTGLKFLYYKSSLARIPKFV